MVSVETKKSTFKTGKKHRSFIVLEMTHDNRHDISDFLVHNLQNVVVVRLRSILFQLLFEDFPL